MRSQAGRMYLKQVGQCPRGVLGCREGCNDSSSWESDGYVCLCAADGGESVAGRTWA